MLVTTVPAVTLIAVVPGCASLSTRILSGFSSKRGIVAGAPAGSGSDMAMPWVRKGRATPVTTPKKTPEEVEVALGSESVPPVAAATVSDATVTRIPSYSSSESNGFDVSDAWVVSAAVIKIGAGSWLPVESNVTVGVMSSVSGGLCGSADGMNSCTVPVTLTELPIAAAAGGALEVNTKMPSDVSGLASTLASGVCRKKPLLRRPVTMPVVVTELPAKGEVAPLP